MRLLLRQGKALGLLPARLAERTPQRQLAVNTAAALIRSDGSRPGPVWWSSPILAQNPSPPLLLVAAPARGFKSKRYNAEGGTAFTGIRLRGSGGDKASGHDGDGDGKGAASLNAFDPKKILERSQGFKEDSTYRALAEALNKRHLSPEDQRLAAASIHGYSAGINTQDDSGTGKKGKILGRYTMSQLLARLALSVPLVIVGVLLLNGNIKFGFKLGSRVAKEVHPEDLNVTFDDVKGCDEAKNELTELVQFLMDPERFTQLGGKLPKGCLLEGPPGTGKTLLAKAVAGEAGVPFFFASGSEFDEVFVGTGARRVRDLFTAAKMKAPCVIFIDEIDSVGSTRSSSPNHPYANQTINQLLSEMDGFVANEGVIVLAATNRADKLDKALLRPGRFDTKVQVPPPDLKGRKEILELYLSKIVHDSTVDVDKLARRTIGFSGAEIENMVNTAAIRAAMENQDSVSMHDFEYSHDKHTLGVDFKSRIRPKDDLRITAYHEAGHTLVSHFTKDSVPLHKVTIIAKGRTGGHTAFLPEDDQYHRTKSQELASIDTAMGGRAAEELVFGKDGITGGASNDLSSATRIAEYMVKELGMCEKVGLRVVQHSDELSPTASEQVDKEINALLSDSYQRAIHILRTHRKELDMLAEALLQYETLDADDIKAIIEGKALRQRKTSSKPSSPSRPCSNCSSSAENGITVDLKGEEKIKPVILSEAI